MVPEHFDHGPDSRARRPREPEPQNTRSHPVPDPGNHPGTRVPPGGSPVPPPYGRNRGPETGTGQAETCIRGPEGRALNDRHRAGCDGADCPGCEPCPEPHCDTCRRSHAVHSCASCVAVARTNLDTITLYVEELPLQAVNGRQAFHHHHGVPGGDATVMLAPASPWRPVGATCRVYAEPGDPRPPLDVLAYWSNRWREEAQLPTQLAPTMARVVDHLDAQLHRIADTPLFPELAKDLARLLHSVENVLHAGYRPDRSRVPCLNCGTRLVKVWAAQEKHDHWRCPLCGEVYDQGRYERAKHDQLASRGADRFVPVSDAIAVTGRPEQTVRAWMRLGLIAVRREDSGRLLVWWPDVREKHRTTPIRRRRTP